MDERIRELAEQAWTMVSDEERTRGELYEADKQRERRDQVFAELIVKECIQVCNSRVGNSDYNTGRMHCASDLKEHFGVEE